MSRGQVTVEPSVSTAEQLWQRELSRLQGTVASVATPECCETAAELLLVVMWTGSVELDCTAVMVEMNLES